MWPNWHARCIQEHPSASFKDGSAPYCISNTTIGRWPCLVAQWSAVELRSPPSWSMIAPFARKYLLGWIKITSCWKLLVKNLGLWNWMTLHRPTPHLFDYYYCQWGAPHGHGRIVNNGLQDLYLRSGSLTCSTAYNKQSYQIWIKAWGCPCRGKVVNGEALRSALDPDLRPHVECPIKVFYII